MPKLTLERLARAWLPHSAYERLASSDIAKRLAKGSFWSMSHAVATRGVTILQGILLARILGVTGFGEWGMVLSTLAVVTMFANFGLSLTAAKHVAQWRASEKQRLGRLLGLLTLLAFGVGATIAILLLILAPAISRETLAAPHLSSAFGLVGVIALLSAVAGVYSGVLTGLERFYESTIASIATTVLGAFITVGCAFSWGLEGATVGLLVSNAVSAAVYWRLCARMLANEGVSPTIDGCWQERREIWVTAIPATAASIMTTPVYWALHSYLVNQPGGYGAMGGFQAGNQWRNAVLFLPSQVLAAFLPVMASLSVNERNRLRAVQARVLLGVSGAAFLSAALVIGLAPLLAGLYGEGFEQFGAVFVLLALQGALESGNAVFRTTLIAINRAWALLWSNAVFAVIALAAAVVLIPGLLATGLALALLIAQGAHLVVQAFLSYRSLTPRGQSLAHKP